MKTKLPRPVVAYMAWNYNNPWECTLRRLRKDCVAAVREFPIDPDKEMASFTVRKVLIIAQHNFKPVS